MDDGQPLCGSGTDFWHWILKRWVVGSASGTASGHIRTVQSFIAGRWCGSSRQTRPLEMDRTPQDGESPWLLHANEIFDRFEPYDGRAYTEYAGNAGGGWNSVWLYPPVLQIFAKYAAENDGYSDCGFGPKDVGDRFGALDVGGVVPEGYR